MRTIENCLRDLRELDPNTDITDCAIRTFVKENKVAVINTGKKIFVNFDSLLEFLGIVIEKVS